MEANWLESFVGQHVTVSSGSREEHNDIGTLLRIGEGWLQMLKDNGEMILMPSSAIRVVKLLDMKQISTGVGREGVAPSAVPNTGPLLNNPADASFPDGF